MANIRRHTRARYHYAIRRVKSKKDQLKKQSMALSISQKKSRQGRKSMFKHGGYDIGVKYTSRLWDVSRGAKRRALVWGFGGMPPQENFF